MNPLISLLNKLPLAIVLFDKNANLIFYNKAVIELWKVSPQLLDNQPSLIDFLESIREKGILPEKDNFREFCNNLYNIAKSNTPYYNKNTLLLAQGIHLQETIQKEDDYFYILWEDISEATYMLNTLSNYKSLYNKIIEKSPIPVTVIASNGIIEAYNSKFLETFSVSSEVLEKKIHARDLLSYMKTIGNHPDNLAILLGNLVSSRSFSLSFEINSLKTLLISGIYLQNSNTFVYWSLHNKKNDNMMDITSDSIIEFHKNLVIDLNHLVGAPVSNIIGFADLLQNNYVGELNIRQKEYMNKIIEKANFINSELDHKISLTELEKNTPEVYLEKIDLNLVISNILYKIKHRLKSKNISISLNVESNLSFILSNEELISKVLNIFMMYIIDHNNHNSEIKISLKKQTAKVILSIEDTSKKTLLSEDDMNTRYDIILATTILKKLNHTLDYASKQRSYRYINIQFLINENN